MNLDAEIAVPIALVVTEPVVNAITHAFPGGRRGNVTIEIAPSEEGMVALTISDDGIGINDSLDNGRSPFMGLQLVKSLVGQIGGTLTRRASNGTSYTLEFMATNARNSSINSQS